MKKTYEVFGIVVEVEDGGGQLLGTLKESCPYCGNTNCYSDPCEIVPDPLNMDRTPEHQNIADEECENRIAYNNVMDGIEALLLALACEGVDISTEPFQIAIKTAVEGAANNI